MAAPSADDFKKLRRRVKKLEEAVGDLWEELAKKDDARAAEEDEIRDIAERNRRSIARHIKDDH